jgi:hypothetical protein
MKSSLFKLIAKGLIMGVWVLALAGAANAATYLNTYGTGEEFNLWQNVGTVILKTPVTESHGAYSGGLGCTSAVTYMTADGNSGVTVGKGCADNLSSDNGTHDGYIYFSFTDLASWDGIDAVNNVYDTDNWATYRGSFADPIVNSGGTSVNPCAPDKNYRKVATCNKGACAGGVATYTCQPIHIGVSNLEASSLEQVTKGTLQGPIDGQDADDNYTWREFFQKNGKPGVDTSNIPSTVSVTVNGALHPRYPNPSNPIFYPYAFYVNPGVKAMMCNSLATDAALVGSSCTEATVATDCGAKSAKAACTSQTINNLTRLQVVALFSGVITHWSDFGDNYTSLPVTLCLRHSGAGTLATMDLGVMQGSPDGKGWGANLVQEENRVASGKPPYIYFNNTQGDSRNCLTWANGGSVSNTNNGVTDKPDLLPKDVKGGAVGFIDADNANKADYVQVKYNGTYPSRARVRDGVYDNFWIVDRLYAAPGLLTGQLAVYGQMLTFAADPANYTDANLGNSRGNYYGAVTELNFPKANAGVYPYVYSPGSTPVTP